MRVREDEHVIELTRRNLLALLAKLDGHPPCSAATLYKQGWFIRAVEDEAHYDAANPAGPMVRETEKRLPSGS